MHLLGLFLLAGAQGSTYDVGPGQPYASIGAVPWESLQPGDTVAIHWRPAPYAEKWVIGRRGAAGAWIRVRGVPGPEGQLPVIDGRDATTRPQLNYWNEDRGVIKVGGANSPPDTTPAYIRIEGLEIRSARPPYTFTGRNGLTRYLSNAAAIYVEKVEFLEVRDCVLHDCGNGFFTAANSEDVLVEGCEIHANGIEGSIYEHNNYTEAQRITFQFNCFGPLRANCPGNNLKDRSAGTVIRYNWIESGNRQLDLVDSDYSFVINLPEYRATFVYGNVLVEPDGAGNSQICHYGGDSGITSQYRKGTLHFYHNTVVSTRSGNTTLFRLSTNQESADCRNNVVYALAGGSRLALLDSSGILDLWNNWLSQGWHTSFSSFDGTLVDHGGGVYGLVPGFRRFGTQDFSLLPVSPCRDAGTALAAAALPEHAVVFEYLAPGRSWPRPQDATADLGAFEFSARSRPSAR
ncbi:MAG: polysaccharide-degrading enzyme [Planctomycetota bacterium]|nr:MAG: polysaccharide-degrading enzyme [Planctomycetota bacterium]